MVLGDVSSDWSVIDVSVLDHVRLLLDQIQVSKTNSEELLLGSTELRCLEVVVHRAQDGLVLWRLVLDEVLDHVVLLMELQAEVTGSSSVMLEPESFVSFLEEQVLLIEELGVFGTLLEKAVLDDLVHSLEVVDDVFDGILIDFVLVDQLLLREDFLPLVSELGGGSGLEQIVGPSLSQQETGGQRCVHLHT